jgi:hypothetical protein
MGTRGVTEAGGQQPSVRGIFAWANARLGEHWPGLFAIALASGIIPVARLAITHRSVPASNAAADWALTLLQELLLLLCTAAMVLLVMRPRGARARDAAHDALAEAPRLVAVKIATALVLVVPTIALGWIAMLFGALLALPFALVVAPLAFVCRLAFTGAVIERSGPVRALLDAFRRAKLSGFWLVVGLTILFSLVEQVPPMIFAWMANVVFPPAPLSVPLPHVPGHAMPQLPSRFPGMTIPGPFGSAIPWGAHVVMLLADMPFFAYLTVLYAGAALAFADTEPPAPEA